MCWAIFGKVTNKQPSDPSASFFLTSVRKQSFAISDLVNCCFGEKVPRCHDLAFKTPTTFRNVTVAELNWGQKVREAAAIGRSMHPGRPPCNLETPSAVALLMMLSVVCR